MTYLRQTNAGPTSVMNAGLARARCKYVGFCDSNNAWLPGKLLSQVPILEDLEHVGDVLVEILPIDEKGQPLPTTVSRRHEGRITGHLLADNFFRLMEKFLQQYPDSFKLWRSAPGLLRDRS